MVRTIRVKYDPNKDLTQEQIEMLEKLEDRPIVFDDDPPEFTKKDLKEFYRVSEAGPWRHRK